MEILVVDLASMFKHSNEVDRRKAVKDFGEACLKFGFLRIINDGLPDELINRSRELTKQFFDRPIDEKLECKPVSTILPAGYGKMNGSFGCNEWLIVCQPVLGFNVFPSCVVRERLEEIFLHFQKLGAMVENLVNDYLGLPSNFLKEFNDDRSKDVLMYDAGGLEYEKAGFWIPVPPVAGSLVVNVGTTIQWIQPLPKFAEEVGEAPKYKGFFYKELLQSRLKKERNPLMLREEVLDLDHFAIPVEDSNC
ncbi:S-norcoclaurine synthase 1-like [Bidens hawaiensis]|uniref:S-norcoclaurine synthase 1-like n=1 Tax=Bidens hawaiensis TaxID=980011 RepID=UPI00404A5372